jgi:hypothetical protein
MAWVAAVAILLGLAVFGGRATRTVLVICAAVAALWMGAFLWWFAHEHTEVERRAAQGIAADQVDIGAVSLAPDLQAGNAAYILSAVATNRHPERSLSSLTFHLRLLACPPGQHPITPGATAAAQCPATAERSVMLFFNLPPGRTREASERVEFDGVSVPGPTGAPPAWSYEVTAVRARAW